MIRFASLGAALVCALAIGTFVGGSWLAPPAVLSALAHPYASGDAATIVWSLRLPRVAIAACVGAALALAGLVLQTLLRNPLVDPFLTGVSSGAGAAIAFAVLAGVAAPLVPALGFAAGIATALAVAAIARRGGGIDAERLILAGVSLSALFSALVTLVLLGIGRTNGDAILAWLAGSVGTRGWSDLGWAAPYLVAGFVLSALAVPSLNALRLGPAVARAVGVDVRRTQWLALAGATLLTAAAVALAGVVGFVGLIVPHVARRAVGTDVRRASVASVVLGATLVPLADALARTVAAPAEIPLGVLLAFIGVPAFLYLYVRSARTRSWGA